ncbi:Y-family DNA polymerase [Candidatus Methylomicrobium oryzae]|uniref:Y-family DNA polymerase n=1 Tax=Candidatus Methylomicrobium oryzae TaxID=2802053 RepID=UPI00192150E5|nr:Y-family DNA polymerase [Methylomicrobium sp. RS1]MBL1265856.1 Y-family DNA polymerase [Methylomicrobium sp. RS1]
MPPLLALVDCNNFYVSCERVFRPDLIGKPVAVLSNNDGCIVARSQEVKDLGIKMGMPVFQVQALIHRHKIQLFSSNYTLYADMSSRVMSILEEFTPSLEVYSIDEAFLDLTGVCDQDPIEYGQRIKKAVLRSTGIQVCVGMGPTKTLAKLANFATKRWQQTGGVLDLSDPIRREKLMRIVPVGEVWGIGSRIAARLNQLGIVTVWDLASQPVDRIRKQFNVVVARTVMELNGIPCLELEEIAPDKQQIVCSRSFSRRLTEYWELSEALAEFGSRAAEKLRFQSSVAGHISVFIRTNPFNPAEPLYQRAAGITLPFATQDTRVIVGTANRLLKELFREGYRYQKCGVQLSRIQPASLPDQMDLFDSAAFAQGESEKLMQAVDRINRRFPKGIVVAAAGSDKSWKPKAERVSNRYTTDWRELVNAKC